MFRRLPGSLPPDPRPPANLERLGYFINDMDQIRMIQHPENKYQYKIDRSDRVNDTFKEAMNTCVRQVVTDRLLTLGLSILRLPAGTSQYDPHVPIFTSQDLQNRKRVVILFGDRIHDAGILSFRTIGDEGLEIGSAAEMSRAILSMPGVKSKDDAPGLIIANPAQLLWYRGGVRPVGDIEWMHLPRASAVHQQFSIDEIKNRIPGNKNYTEHVQYIFEHVLTNQVNKDAVFDIIALEYTGLAVMQYLHKNWSTWSARISAICLSNPQHTITELAAPDAIDNDFIKFVRQKTRAYFVSDAALETPIAGLDNIGCNCYSSSEPHYEERILVKAWRSILDWFNLVHAVNDYKEPDFTMIEVSA